MKSYTEFPNPLKFSGFWEEKKEENRLKKLNSIIILLLLMILPFCTKKVNTIPAYMQKGNPEYIINQGYQYLNQGILTKAEERFKKALRMIPNHLRALNGLGIIYLKQKKFNLSRSEFEKILQLDPRQVDAYNFLGIIYSETGNYEKSKENFLIAANSSEYKTPENAYQNLAMLEIKHKKLDSALRYIEKGIKLNRDFPGLYTVRGIIYETKGLNNKALYNYERALALAKNKDLTYKINVARGYIKTGQKTKALNILEKMLAEVKSEGEREVVRKMIKSLDH